MPAPRTFLCHLCGRPYGINSFEIHLKQCKDLWTARESQKPAKDRKPLPEDPPFLADARRDSNEGLPALSCAALSAQNQAALDHYNSAALSTCAFCGRTFLPEKLVIHNRSCTADHPAKSVADSLRRETDSSAHSSSKLPPRSAATSGDSVGGGGGRGASRPQTAPSSGDDDGDVRRTVSAGSKPRGATRRSRTGSNSSGSEDDRHDPDTTTDKAQSHNNAHPRASVAHASPQGDMWDKVLQRVDSVEESARRTLKAVTDLRTLVLELKRQADPGNV